MVMVVMALIVVVVMVVMKASMVVTVEVAMTMVVVVATMMVVMVVTVMAVPGRAAAGGGARRRRRSRRPSWLPNKQTNDTAHLCCQICSTIHSLAPNIRHPPTGTIMNSILRKLGTVRFRELNKEEAGNGRATTHVGSRSGDTPPWTWTRTQTSATPRRCRATNARLSRDQRGNTQRQRNTNRKQQRKSTKRCMHATKH
ncbi:hypothetical protein ACJJTC_003757 [Scirpophaga incertulas]